MFERKIKLYIDDYLKKGLDIFNEHSMLKPFSDKQLQDFVNDASCFALSLNRPRAQGVMYSLAHIRYRKAFFNGLDLEARLAIFQKKMQYLGLNELLITILLQEGLSDSTLKNVYDIGAGHSVFLLVFDHGSYVIKHEMLKTQCFMSSLLKRFSWPSLKSFHVSNSFGSWELLEYGGEHDLESYLIADFTRLTSRLIQDLAKHAALGDCIGRGDRHFQNYIYRDEKLFPLDLSYLFSDNHEQWFYFYCKAGMGELGALQLILHDNNKFIQFFNLFFNTYIETFDFLRTHQLVLLDHIDDFFDDITQKNAYLFFTKQRLNSQDYLVKQIKQYHSGFQVFVERLIYKKHLQTLVSEGLDLTKYDPVLAMYYQADYQRFSAFFLLDEFKRQEILFSLDSLLTNKGESIQNLKNGYLPCLSFLNSVSMKHFLS